MIMDGRISNEKQIASIERYTVTRGAGRGLDVIDCSNGRLRFKINVTKACDIMQAWYEGTNLSFISKNGFTLRETPFAKRFEGGMLYTCGLDSVGDRRGFETHGSLHNTPAEIVCAECDESGITVQALIRDTELFGKNLVLKRTITSGIGENSITVCDRLVNSGCREEDYCLLYHVNVGYPMLDAGCRIVADVQDFVARTPWAEKMQSGIYEIGGSVSGQEETCYFLHLQKPEITLVNRDLGKKFTLAYSKETLPYFVEWKSMASGDYALGLEPCTTELDDRFRYKKISSGEEITFWIKLSVEDMENNGK